MNINAYRNNHFTGDWESIRRMDSDDRKPVSKASLPWSSVYFLSDGTKLTKEQSEAMYKEVYKPIVDGQKKIAKNNKKVLASIKLFKSPVFYRGLTKYIADLKSSCSNIEDMAYSIVDNHSGRFQNEKWGTEISGVWVEQWATGTEGDSWAGNVYIQIFPGKHLKINFDC